MRQSKYAATNGIEVRRILKSISVHSRHVRLMNKKNSLGNKRDREKKMRIHSLVNNAHETQKKNVQLIFCLQPAANLQLHIVFIDLQSIESPPLSLLAPAPH